MISGQPISETSRKIINPNPIHFKRVDLFTVRLICVINLFVPDHARTIYLNSNNQLKKKQLNTSKTNSSYMNRRSTKQLM